MNNPFTLMYGIPSNSMITRNYDTNIISDAFIADKLIYSYLITGIRGSGKTVFLREICKILSNHNFLVINVNPQNDILNSLANNLYFETQKYNFFVGWNVYISLKSISFSKNHSTINDPEIISRDIIKKLNNKNIKVLIAIDEVNNTLEFKKFVNFYQNIIGEQLPLYLLMTGINENVDSIINDKAMTFLTRIPKIEIKALDLANIAYEYQKIFNLDIPQAVAMAKLTNGYAFAYQVLGYLFFEDKKKELSDSFISQYEHYLWNNGYNKFWQDLSNNEKEFLIGLAKSKHGSKQEILDNSNLKENNFSQYRKKLLNKQLIISKDFNELKFVLPSFDKYILFLEEYQ